MSEPTRKRRQFLADLLFAGGAAVSAALLARAVEPEPEPVPPPPRTQPAMHRDGTSASRQRGNGHEAARRGPIRHRAPSGGVQHARAHHASALRELASTGQIRP